MSHVDYAYRQEIIDAAVRQNIKTVREFDEMTLKDRNAGYLSEVQSARFYLISAKKIF